MRPTARWRELLEDRVAEAVDHLGRSPGVLGFLVGGSVGRGEPWPLSDIDLLPVYAGDTAPDGPPEDLDRRRAELVDWWAASGRAQTLDLAWLCFTEREIGTASAAGPDTVAARMADRRWFHGIDKGYGARAAVTHRDGAGIAGFAARLTGVRFHPLVVAARIDEWRGQMRGALADADRLAETDPAAATHRLRDAARAARLVLLEGWGERLGSMGREWTRWERMAERHGRSPLAARIAVVASADPAGAADRARLAPAWLRERIDLAYAARLAVGETVTEQENARDQLAAFTVHVVRHRPELDGPWTASPDPLLGSHLAELRRIAGGL